MAAPTESPEAPAQPHAQSVEAVFAALGTGPTGLSSSEARERLVRFGRNELPRGKPPSVMRIFLRQFLSPLIYILLIAAAISAFLGDWSDAGFILGVLVLNAVIGSVQEFSAERSAQALCALTGTRAFALRDGTDVEIDASQLVPGDVVIVEAGSKVPADLRLISNGGIETDESLLTGESLPVTKHPLRVLEPSAALGDRTNLAFAATLVTRGRARGVVVATGLQTQVGRIAGSLVAAKMATPPLLVRMERFTRKIALSVVLAVSLLGLVSVTRGNPLSEVFLLAVALAVSAIPEGLPVALTVALSIGARRMARCRVIARRLVAVESLGSCTFIASDKTGTLTMNELTVRKLLLPGEQSCEVTGQGVTPEGEVEAPDPLKPLLVRLSEAAVSCNDGFLGLRAGQWAHHGDAVDVALLSMAAKLGVHRPAVEGANPRVAEIPFEPENRFAATFHRSASGLHVAVKGAGERLLPMCTRMATRSGDVPIDVEMLEREANVLATQGYRVLALATGPVKPSEGHEDELGTVHLRGLVFLGIVGMIDPLRPEAKVAVQACQAAGITVAMVTGDHPVTALAIARELGLAERPEQVVTGPALQVVAERGEAAVDALVRGAAVFARVEPNQKLQIVQSLKRLGHFVAVTGDGANDAPALRAAHIGVAMGQRGTDVARESSDLILTDDNFASIVSGVELGRVAYANVRKVVFLLLSSGAAEVLLFVLTTAAGLPVPLWPVQLLWLNLVTNGIQDVALAFEPPEGGELSRNPRPPKEPIFNRLMIERTLMSALIIAFSGFFAYRWMLDSGWPVERAQNGVLLLLVLFENVQAGNSRSETTSALRMNPMRNRLLFVGTLAAQLLHIGAMHTPVLRAVLHLQPVSSEQWLLSLGAALLLLGASETQKFSWRRRHPGRSA